MKNRNRNRFPKITANNTVVLDDGDVVQVILHKTCVFEWARVSNTATLRTGGWFTVTTKARINQAFAQFNLPYCVFQRAGKWFVSSRQPYEANKAPFSEGMQLHATGAVTTGERA
jgi:hypothetical protein